MTPTKAFAPNWLSLAMLPLLAAALFAVDAYLQGHVWKIARMWNSGDFSLLGFLFGAIVGPVLTAALFVYPIARLYPRHWLAASALIVAPVALSAIFSFPDDEIAAAGLLIEVCWLSLLLLVAASLACRELAGSRLVILATGSPTPGSGVAAVDDPKSAVPFWLWLALFPILAIAMAVTDNIVQGVAWDVGFMPGTRPLKLAGFIAAAILGPATTAILFAYPIARSYGRHAAVAGALVASHTIWWRATHHLHDAHLPWVIAAYRVELVSFAVLVPLAAWMMSRRLGNSRLAIIDHESEDSSARMPPSRQPNSEAT